MNFKDELIKTNNELIIALQNQITYIALVKDVAPKTTIKLVGAELDDAIKTIEARIGELKNKTFSTLEA